MFAANVVSSNFVLSLTLRSLAKTSRARRSTTQHLYIAHCQHAHICSECATGCEYCVNQSMNWRCTSIGKRSSLAPRWAARCVSNGSELPPHTSRLILRSPTRKPTCNEQLGMQSGYLQRPTDLHDFRIFLAHLAVSIPHIYGISGAFLTVKQCKLAGFAYLRQALG